MRTEVTKSSKTRLWVGIVLHAPTSWGWGAIFNSWVQHYFSIVTPLSLFETLNHLFYHCMCFYIRMNEAFLN